MDTNVQRPESAKELAEGIAMRAGVLVVGGLVVGTWLFTLAAKAASGVVKIATGGLLLAIGAGVATWEVKKVQRRLQANNL
jgi:hypothetical protein